MIQMYSINGILATEKIKLKFLTTASARIDYLRSNSTYVGLSHYCRRRPINCDLADMTPLNVKSDARNFIT